MAKKLTCDIFSLKSIEQLQRDLEAYKQSIISKCQEAVSQLADVGIEVCKTSVSGKAYGDYIVFSKKIEPTENGCKAIIVATNTQMITAEWKLADGTIKRADISPILFEEFGSGFKAQNPLDVPGMGQGTFPNQEHAFDSGGWSWYGTDNRWYHSTGYAPSMPMYKASEAMFEQAIAIVKGVFSS